MAWNLTGMVAAVLLAAFALWRSRVGGSFYDAQVYGMTPALHRRYALAAVAFAAIFGATLWRALPMEIVLYAAFTLLALFYLTSFLRGAQEDDD